MFNQRHHQQQIGLSGERVAFEDPNVSGAIHFEAERTINYVSMDQYLFVLETNAIDN